MKTFQKISLFFLFHGVVFIACPLPGAAGVLVQEQHLVYEGAFRVPKGNLGGASKYSDTLARGGQGLTYNPANNSLIMVSRFNEQLAVEISLPTPKISTDIASLNTASVLQLPGQITDGNWMALKADGSLIANNSTPAAIPGGLLVYNNKLIGTSYAYYDSPAVAARSHFTASTTWAQSGSQFKGMFRVGTPPYGIVNGGFVGGYMATVPSEWQSALGYPVLTGLGGLTIISRTSYGPCAFGFDPNNLGVQDPVNATFLLGYPEGHETLGSWTSGGNLYWNKVTAIRGLVFPQGSDTLLFFGKHGYGLNGTGGDCYGTGTSNISLQGTAVGDGSYYCYDPVDSTKGTHAYPYYYQVWAYNAKGLAEVKSGIKKAWDVVPYARWDLKLSFPYGEHQINGVAYDPKTQRIFIAQDQADGIYNKYERYPLIQVYKLNLTTIPHILNIN